MSEANIAPWQRIAQSKKARRDSAIPTDWQLHHGQVPEDRLNVIDVPVKCGILTPCEVEITETDAPVLVKKMINMEYSSYQVGKPHVSLHIMRKETN